MLPIFIGDGYGGGHSGRGGIVLEDPCCEDRDSKVRLCGMQRFLYVDWLEAAIDERIAGRRVPEVAEKGVWLGILMIRINLLHRPLQPGKNLRM